LRLLLDTHALLWAWADPQKLSMAAAGAIQDPSNFVMVSAASAWEIATKVRLGKLPGHELTVFSFHQRLAMNGFSELAVTVAHGLAAGQFDLPHRDPFDRILAAQALAEGALLVSNDEALRSFPCRFLW
jgi:PIN domain nuclease of toxin-antitoxin system